MPVSPVSVAFRDKQVTALLTRMSTKARDMTRLMTIYYGLVHREVMSNFRNEGSYGDILSGKPSSAFKKWKHLGGLQKARRKGGTILSASNRLRMSMGTVRKIMNKSMEYGTDQGISATHHFGAVIVPKKAKFLTLPFPDVEGRARDYKNTFIAKGIFEPVTFSNNIALPPRSACCGANA